MKGGRTGARRAARVLGLIFLFSLLAAFPAEDLRAQAAEDGDPALSASVGGYVHAVTGIQDTGYPVPFGDSRSGFNGEVLRLQWRASWEDRVVFDVHQRVQAQLSTTSGGIGGSVAGLGVTREPGRAFDLESVWIDDDRLRLWHDLDRAALTIYTESVDWTVGRQGISWGTSLLFPVSDLWAPFSPFELDTEVRPGIDAVRALAYPVPGLELDAVVADRGDRDPWSGGVRGTWSLSSADVYASVARVWNEVVVAGGLTWLFDTIRTRGELLVPRDLDEERWMDPRLTVGLDWLGTRFTLTGEYHFNGLGAADSDGYLSVFGSETYARGESYFLGRHYVGGLASWTVDRDERFHLNASVLGNVGDPSLAVFPALRWTPGQTTSVSFGGLLTLGEHPTFPSGTIPDIRSEYGTYGTLGYTRVSVFF